MQIFSNIRALVVYWILNDRQLPTQQLHLIEVTSTESRMRKDRNYPNGHNNRAVHAELSILSAPAGASGRITGTP